MTFPQPLKDSDQEEEDEDRSWTEDEVRVVWGECVWFSGAAVKAFAYYFPQPLMDLDQEEGDEEWSGDYQFHFLHVSGGRCTMST